MSVQLNRTLTIAFAAFQLVAISLCGNEEEQKFELKVGNTANFKVDSRMEVKGTLYLDPAEQTRSIPMNVQANYSYGERLATTPDLIKAIRYYEKAESKIKLSTGSTTSTLDQANRYLILERRTKAAKDKRVRFQSPEAKLTESELNLINVPANTMLLSQWLQTKATKLGETWITDGEILADILTWDSVETNEITARIVDVTSGIAKVEIKGTAMGMIDGADTEARVEGTCNFELKLGYVSNARLRISENRDAGLVSPGYEADIWLENAITPANQTRLTNAALGQLKMNPASRADQMLLGVECGPYQLTHQRHWRVISNRTDRTVLRCIKDGAVIGQCDIVPLPNQPAGAPVSLQQFQMNVQKALTNGSGQVVSGQQSPSIAQQKWMRVDAVGQSNEIQMRWIYVTITAPDLQRVQLLFTLEQAVFEEFSGFEQELIDSFEILNPDTRQTGSGRSAEGKSSSRR